MITPEQMQTLIEEKEKTLRQQLKDVASQIEAGTLSKEEIDAPYLYWYLDHIDVVLERDETLTEKKVLQNLEELKEWTKDDTHKPKFEINLTCVSDYDAEDAELFWEATYIDIPRSENRCDSLIKKELREYVGELIKPSSTAHSSFVDCNDLKMFLDAELTYKGLVNSTYSSTC